MSSLPEVEDPSHCPFCRQVPSAVDTPTRARVREWEGRWTIMVLCSYHWDRKQAYLPPGSECETVSDEEWEALVACRDVLES